MCLRPLFKIFSRLFHKKWSLTKRQRNPTSFQECVEPQQSHGYWRPVLLVFFLVPTIYYMSYFRGLSDYNVEPYNENMVVNKQESATDSVTGDIITIHKKYKKDDPIIVHDSPAKRIFTHVSDELPLCTTVTVATTNNDTNLVDDLTFISTNNSDSEIAYKWDIKRGGHFIPKDCRPRHRVAILVPYWWSREKDLKLFLYYIHPFLKRQRLEYRIFIIEQDGKGPINKGRLFNAGFLEIQKNDDWQCVIFHDVELLPADYRIRYTCPVLPRNMCTAVVGKDNVMRRNNVFGGVTAMTMWHFKKANGYSNLYWGRGESEDMFKRLQAAGIGVTRYRKDIGKYISLKHSYRPDNPNRVQLLVTAAERYKDDGLSNLQYNVASYASSFLYTHIVVNVNNVVKQPDYITELSVTLSP